MRRPTERAHSCRPAGTPRRRLPAPRAEGYQTRLEQAVAGQLQRLVERRVTHLRTPVAELPEGGCFRQPRCLGRDRSGHPLWKRYFLGDVAPGGRVYLMDLGKLLLGKTLRNPN